MITRRRWTLGFICLGVLMIDADTTIVAVAVPSIATDLHLSGSSLTWLLNGYNLVFGGLLLLSGGLGDSYGGRRVFLLGVSVFIVASAAAGLARTGEILLAARAAQGFGAALITAVSLSLITQIFPESAERAKALGLYGFVCAAGGSVGELAGGLLTKTLSWHAIFLINLPTGVLVYGACFALLPQSEATCPRRRLDIVGAVTITVSLGILVYALVHGGDPGWTSPKTLRLFSICAGLLTLFVVREHYAHEPLVPPSLFKSRNFISVNVITLLWSAGSFPWFVLTALYVQHVLHYDPLEVGLTFLPAAVLTAILSVCVSARLALRFGTRSALSTGLLLTAAGLSLFSRVRLNAEFGADLLPGILLIGLGSGIAFNPLLLAGMSDVESDHSAVASGAINTSFMIGGALGLACLAALADARTGELQRSGVKTVVALLGGYQEAFSVAATLIAIAGVLAAVVLRPAPLADTRLRLTTSL